MKSRSFWLLCLALGTWFLYTAMVPAPKKRTSTIGFYNVENLFDTWDDPKTNDEQFLPTGDYKWTKENLGIKLDNLAKVISQMGDEDGPEILGLAEVENRDVVEMLVKNKQLKKHGYEVIHSDSPDQRGIDCAMIYKKKKFVPLYQQSYSVSFADTNPDITTRDILLVKGILEKDFELTILVNHWSSRRGGAQKSAWKRARAASRARAIVDSILKVDPLTNIVLMGDFNDEPSSPSLDKILRAGKNTQEASYSKLYNCMAKLEEDGMGSLRYKQYWDMFDQIILTYPMMLADAPLKYVDCSAGIYNPKWMRVEREGDWKDAPKRSHIRRKFYPDGYSDHFPVYVQLEY